MWIKQYDVFVDPEGKYEEQIVKRGFSWLAFLFPPLWAMFKGYPLLGVGLIALSVAVNMGTRFLPPDAAALRLAALLAVGVGASLWLGLRGNAMVRKHVLGCGFAHSVTLRARTVSGVLKQLEARKPAQPAG